MTLLDQIARIIDGKAFDETRRNRCPVSTERRRRMALKRAGEILELMEKAE